MEMRIGIIIFSYTGHSFKVAKEIEKDLTEKGYTVGLERIETDGDAQKMGNDIKFKTVPNVDRYDALIFGAPVWAFHLNPIMNRYLSDISEMKGKKAAVFVTKEFTPKWTGGIQSVKKMANIIEKKGGKVIGSDVIGWKKKKGPEDNMNDKAREIANLF